MRTLLSITMAQGLHDVVRIQPTTKHDNDPDP